MQPDKLQLALEKAKRTSALVEVRRSTGRREGAHWGGGDPAGRVDSYWVPPLPQVAYATYPPRLSPPKPSPPARRMRLRDIMTSAVRSALSNPQLDQEAERFNNEIGATFMEALGTVVKKEK